MAQQRRPRRRVPARVYWVRRLAVLGTAFLLVFAVGRLLVGSSDGADSDHRTPARCRPPPAPARRRPVGRRRAGRDPAAEGHQEAPQVPAAEADHPRRWPSRAGRARPTTWSSRRRCATRSVAAMSSIALMFRTLVSPACTFEVSARDGHHEHHLGQRPDLVDPPVPGSDADHQRGRPQGPGDVRLRHLERQALRRHLLAPDRVGPARAGTTSASPPSAANPPTSSSSSPAPSPRRSPPPSPPSPRSTPRSRRGS